VKIDGILLDPSQYRVNSDKLIIPHTTLVAALGVPVRRFQVETKVAIRPDKNLSLSGLYKSGQSSLLSTQCEAMGFRRIAYHLDRPDVLSRYRVRLEADKLRYPLLLSNGNCIEQGDATTASSSSSSSSSKRHYAVWDDPFPKPSYLFALVAGNLTYLRTLG
jgi:aminopeptidase N